MCPYFLIGGIIVVIREEEVGWVGEGETEIKRSKEVGNLSVYCLSEVNKNGVHVITVLMQD